VNEKTFMVVIPARLNSSRLPEKVLEDIHGRPMIYWVAKRVISAKLARVVVATDSDKVLKVCTHFEIPVVMTSTECKNGTERVYEASKNFLDVDYFINVQADEPLINTEVIRDVMSAPINPHSFYTAVSPIKFAENNPSEIKVALGGNNRIRFASRSLIPYSRDGINKHYKIHGVYLYSREILSSYIAKKPGDLELMENVEQLRCIEHDIPIFGIKTSPTERSVDTIDDLNYMKKMPKSDFASGID